MKLAFDAFVPKFLVASSEGGDGELLVRVVSPRLGTFERRLPADPGRSLVTSVPLVSPYERGPGVLWEFWKGTVVELTRAEIQSVRLVGELMPLENLPPGVMKL